MTQLIIPSRRKFLTCLVGLVAAPAVVKADSLMRVRTIAAVQDPHDIFNIMAIRRRPHEILWGNDTVYMRMVDGFWRVINPEEVYA